MFREKLRDQAKLGKTEKTLISVFASSLRASTKHLYMQERPDTRLFTHAAIRFC